MTDIFKLNGVSSYTHNLNIISIEGRYSIPKKQYESIEVPGRTGNLLIDTGATLNKDITIQCCLNCGLIDATQIRIKIKQITEWLIGNQGYSVLEFSDGGIFNAIVKDEVKVVHNTKENIFVFTIVFECYEVI